jgi:hypothetical protein
MADRLTMERFQRGCPPDRDFDIAYWQALGPARIVEAAWELVVDAARIKGLDESQLTLQRSVEKFQRGRRDLDPGRGTPALE